MATSRERLQARRAAGGGGVDAPSFQPLLPTPQADALLAQVQQNIGGAETGLAKVNRFLGGGTSPQELAEIAAQQQQVERTRGEEIAAQQARDFAQVRGIPQDALGVPGRPGEALPGAILGRELATGTSVGAQQQFAQQVAGTPEALVKQDNELRRAQLENEAVAAEARAELIPLQITEVQDRSAREATAFKIKNFRDYAGDVRVNPALAKGTQALVSYQQLDNSLTNPKASALDLQNGIVALAQILEPGLAVRNDDRIAITGSASDGLTRLANDYNQFISGEVDLSVARTNMLRSAQSLIEPRAAAWRETVRFYDGQIAPATPGVAQGDIFGILGVTDELIRTVNSVAPEADFDFRNSPSRE